MPLSPLLSECAFGVGFAAVIYAALHDIGFRTVPNWVSVVILATGIICRVLAGEIEAGLIIGTAMFCLTFTFWRFGWMGGGDVKLLTAAAVFTHPWHVPQLVMATAVCGGLLAILYFAAGFIVPAPHRARPAGFLARVLRVEQRRLHYRGPLPYAAAIAVGGVLATLAT